MAVRNPDPEQVRPRVRSPKSEVRVRPGRHWSENRTIVRNLTRTKPPQRRPAQDRLRLPWLAAPEYRTIVTSYAYLDAVKGVSLVYLGKKPNNCDIPKPGRSRHRTKKNPRSVMQLGFLPNKLKDLARSPPHLQDLLCPICLVVSISQSPSKMIFIKIEVLVAL